MSDARQNQRRWKLIELLNWTTEHLTQKGFDNARLEAERLLAHALGLKRVDLYLNFDRPLVADELAAFKALLLRRLNHEPLQYILQETEFYSLPFKVAPGVLIPRPETEILVEKALETMEHIFPGDAILNILDVGTGSGNIAVAVAKNRPGSHVVAVDISPEAIRIAKENAERNGVADQIRFEQRDALAPWPDSYRHFFDVILSNPPYVSEIEFEKLSKEIRNFEPREALLAGEKGLDFFKNFSQITPSLLREKGVAFFEIGAEQALEVKEIFARAGFSDIRILRDLAQKDRVVEMIK